ncbi:MAG: sigma-70 family RNA polymerase sigma factor [Chitinophagaceae bacterium]
MIDKTIQIKEWVENYSEDLFSWALYRTSSRETAEDLVQETFMAAYQSWDKFNHESAPKTWLYAILKNKLMDYFRKKARNIVISESELLPEGEQSSFFDLFFDKNGTWKKDMRPQHWNTEDEHLLDNTSFRKILHNCLNKLPPQWNNVISLKYLEERKGNDICKEMDITPSNLWQILYRARLQLRACLEKNWFKT